jgi:hypothetical protein
MENEKSFLEMKKLPISAFPRTIAALILTIFWMGFISYSLAPLLFHSLILSHGVLSLATIQDKKIVLGRGSSQPMLYLSYFYMNERLTYAYPVEPFSYDAHQIGQDVQINILPSYPKIPVIEAVPFYSSSLPFFVYLALLCLAFTVGIALAEWRWNSKAARKSDR